MICGGTCPGYQIRGVEASVHLLLRLAPPEGKFRSTGSMAVVAANNWERIVRPDSAVQPQQFGKPR